MKTPDDIQKAHDTFIALILGDIEIGADAEMIRHLTVACDVLCWVLEHEHNQNFSANLGKLEYAIQAAGYKVFNLGKPIVPGTPEYFEALGNAEPEFYGEKRND